MPDKIPHIRHTENGRRAWTHIGDMQLIITSRLCPAGLNKLIRDDISTAIELWFSILLKLQIPGHKIVGSFLPYNSRFFFSVFEITGINNSSLIFIIFTKNHN
jgi:hypothetical protein